MRRVVVYNYSQDPPQVVGRAVLGKDGRVVLHEFPPMIRQQLEKGIRDWKTNTRTTLDDRDAFLDAMLVEFSGAYVRATTVGGSGRQLLDNC